MQGNIKLDGVEKALQIYDPKQVEKVARATLNKVAKAGKTAASDLIRNELGVNLRKTDLDRKIDIKPARGSALQATIVVTGEPILLTYFNAQSISSQGIKTFAAKNKGGGAMIGLAQKQMKRGGTGRVQVQIMKGKTTILNDRTFIAQGKGGVTMVFLRTASGKLIGKKVYTEASMFNKPKVMDAVKGRIIEQWQKEWSNQIVQLKSGAGWTTTE